MLYWARKIAIIRFKVDPGNNDISEYGSTEVHIVTYFMAVFVLTMTKEGQS